MATKLGYSVVEFTNENNVAVVSSTWLTQTGTGLICSWPGSVGPSFSNQILRHAKPKDNWLKYPCRLLKSYDNYKQAVKACAKAEITSNLETSGPEATPFKRRRRIETHRPNKRQRSSSPGTSVDGGESDLESVISLPSTPITNIDKTLSSTSDYASSIAIDQNSSVLHETADQEVHQAQYVYTLGDQSIIYDQLTGIQTECRRFQETVLSQLATISSNIQELLRRFPSAEATVQQQDTLVGLPDLPISSLEAWSALNDWLNLDGNIEKLQKQLMFIGGKSPSAITQRILNHVLANHIAEKLSLTGRGKKTVAGINDTAFYQLLLGTVRASKGGELATNNNINDPH